MNTNTTEAAGGTTDAIRSIDPLDARRIELAVHRRAGFYAAVPFIGQNPSDITRYIADGELADRLPHIARRDLWDIVAHNLSVRPALMRLDDDARAAEQRHHDSIALELEAAARRAAAEQKFHEALEHLTELQLHDPDHILKPGLPVATVREAISRRAN